MHQVHQGLKCTWYTIYWLYNFEKLRNLFFWHNFFCNFYKQTSAIFCRPQSNNKSEYKTSGSKSNQHDILTPGSLQYFITSLASATVGLGNQDNGFIRRLNNNPSLSINKAIEGKKRINEIIKMIFVA